MITNIWHLTDVHVDPYYVTGSDAARCYCETYESCPRSGSTCNLAPDHTTAAQFWGTGEGDCATPPSLYGSAMDFISTEHNMVYYTGDFAEAGAPYACIPTDNATLSKLRAEEQVISIIKSGWSHVKLAVNNSRVFGTLGNHDVVPGDVCKGTSEMKWLYETLTEIWADDLNNEPAALSTLLKGGYYSTNAGNNLQVISLNTNYLTLLNPEMKNTTSNAYQLGLDQLDWFDKEVKRIAALVPSRKIHILGHIMPASSDNWVDNFYERFQYSIQQVGGSEIVKGLFWGHVHTDQWTLTRECNASAAAVVKEDQKKEQKVPKVPKVQKEEILNATKGPIPNPCTGKPTAIMLAGPSLTEGYPATYPAIRKLQFTTETWDLYDAITYNADIHTANNNNLTSLPWKLLYSFRENYKMNDLSMKSFADLHTRMSMNNSKEWEMYRGGNDERTTSNYYCSGYVKEGQLFPAVYNCNKICEGECKTNWIQWLKGLIAAPPA